MVVRKRLDISGPALAFITTTVFRWQPILTQNKIGRILIEELRTSTTINKLSIISFVIMPSHIHLLLGFPDIQKLSKVMQGFKSVTSRKVKKLSVPELQENDFKLWKPRFDDLIITTEKQLKIKMEYIHHNPVKAGLTVNAEDWKYSSARDWLTDKEGLIKIDKNYSWFVR